MVIRIITVGVITIVNSYYVIYFFFFFSSRRRHTRLQGDWSSDVCSSDLNDDGTDYWTPSHIEASVGLHPYGEWKSGLTKQQLIAKMAARFDQLPGYSVGFMQPMIDGVQDKLSGAHSDLTVKVFGQDLAEDRRVADALVAVLEKVPGAADVAVDVEPPLPSLRIALDRAAAARYGINASDVAQLISTGVGEIGRAY